MLQLYTCKEKNRAEDSSDGLLFVSVLCRIEPPDHLDRERHVHMDAPSTKVTPTTSSVSQMSKSLYSQMLIAYISQMDSQQTEIHIMTLSNCN